MSRVKDAMLDGDNEYWRELGTTTEGARVYVGDASGCPHPERCKQYRLNDRSTGWWLCRYCGYETAPEPESMSDEAHKENIDALFGAGE